jgi:hypothetical protein
MRPMSQSSLNDIESGPHVLAALEEAQIAGNRA